MSVVKESRDNVMLSNMSPASPSQGLGSPIATELINVEGDGDVFARFVHFPSEGIIDLVERPPQTERSRDHQVRTQCCIHSWGPFQSPLPYDLKTGLLIRLSVAQGKCHKEYSLFEEGCSEFPVVRSDDKDAEEAAWDRFFDTYGFRKLNASKEEVILAGKSLGGGGSSS